MKPHVHAETIKAWADGATIQFRWIENDRWTECDDPASSTLPPSLQK
jgi:hypothetical protein